MTRRPHPDYAPPRRYLTARPRPGDLDLALAALWRAARRAGQDGPATIALMAAMIGHPRAGGRA